jgi:hypothetical protein
VVFAAEASWAGKLTALGFEEDRSLGSADVELMRRMIAALAIRVHRRAAARGYRRTAGRNRGQRCGNSFRPA